jgi:hypothetical protein
VNIRSTEIRLSWRLYLALVLLAWLVNYPGRIQSDTLSQLTEAQNLEKLSDWHSPVVTWLFSLFTPALGQPASALLVQALLVFFYPAITLRPQDHRGLGVTDVALGVAWAVLVAALIGITGEILKDVVMVGAILCLLALLDLRPADKVVQLWFALALLVLIVTIRRTNFLMLGIAGGVCALFALGAGRKFVFSLLLILILSAAAFYLPNFINRKVLGARDAKQETGLIIFDIAGISSDIKQNLFSQLPGWSGEQVQRPWECYTPKGADPFTIYGDCKQYLEGFAAAMQRADAPSPVQWWLHNVLRHPISYLKHRVSYTVELFKNGSPIVGWGPYALNTPKDIGVISGAVTKGRDEGLMTYGIDMAQKIQMWEPTIAAVPFYWIANKVFARRTSLVWGLAFCVVTLLWWWRNRLHRQIDIVVVASSALGLGNVLMLVAFGIGDDGRYLAPTLVCGIVSLLRTVYTERERVEGGFRWLKGHGSAAGSDFL